MDAHPALIEFPADDPDRARRFWEGLLGQPLDAREAEDGEGWQTASAAAGETRQVGAASIGVHARGRGPGDTFSLPYFSVADLPPAIERVKELGGSVVHPGERWAVCRDSEGTPFGLARAL
jgi:predicted enzyme related to lactoylglutathione lyase